MARLRVNAVLAALGWATTHSGGRPQTTRKHPASPLKARSAADQQLAPSGIPSKGVGRCPKRVRKSGLSAVAACPVEATEPDVPEKSWSQTGCRLRVSKRSPKRGLVQFRHLLMIPAHCASALGRPWAPAGGAESVVHICLTAGWRAGQTGISFMLPYDLSSLQLRLLLSRCTLR